MVESGGGMIKGRGRESNLTGGEYGMGENRLHSFGNPTRQKLPNIFKSTKLESRLSAIGSTLEIQTRFPPRKNGKGVLPVRHLWSRSRLRGKCRRLLKREGETAWSNYEGPVGCLNKQHTLTKIVRRVYTLRAMSLIYRLLSYSFIPEKLNRNKASEPQQVIRLEFVSSRNSMNSRPCLQGIR